MKLRAAHLDTPFDQYGRQFIVAELINGLRDASESMNVLDVGGYKGKTAEFCVNDNIVVLDVEDIDEENYIKGDGTKLPFPDSSFDVVCSFDVLEHIPRKSRARFIGESLRVARKGVFLACPFDTEDKKTSNYEKELNRVYKTVNQTGHRWLEEHIACVLPTQSEIEAICTKNGAGTHKLFTNRLEDWAVMQEAIFMATLLTEPSFDVGALNRYYNLNFASLEAGLTESDTYRVVYFISKHKGTIASVREAAGAAFASRYNGDAHEKLLIEALQTIARVQAQGHTEQARIIARQAAERERKVRELNEVIASIQHSTSWKITQPLRSLNQGLHSIMKLIEGGGAGQ